MLAKRGIPRSLLCGWLGSRTKQDNFKTERNEMTHSNLISLLFHFVVKTHKFREAK